ncbi:MAG: hypothetical protein M9894_21895 [Planctomycetes bacterium]|nr:hypothetical protein [Planctomycetota bacterium]
MADRGGGDLGAKDVVEALSPEQRERLERLRHHPLPLEPGIAPLVALLWWHGIPTWGSCEGHVEHGSGPWVGVGSEAALDSHPELAPSSRAEGLRAALKLAAVLRAFYSRREAHPVTSLHLMFSPAAEEFGFCELRSHGSSVLGLSSCIPRDQEAELVLAMQDELRAFGLFLRTQPRGIATPAVEPGDLLGGEDSPSRPLVEQAATALAASGFAVVRWSEGRVTEPGSEAPSIEFNAASRQPIAADSRLVLQENVRQILALQGRAARAPRPGSLAELLGRLHVDYAPGPRTSFLLGPQGREIIRILDAEARANVIRRARRNFRQLLDSSA